MGLKKSDIQEIDCSKASFLGSWHANLLYIDRKKCVLFVNDKTLFNFIAVDVSRLQLKNLDVIFLELLQCVLADINIDQSKRKKILTEYEDLAYGKTNSRSVLGSMNDLASIYKNRIISEGGVHSYKIPEMILDMNQMPMSAINYNYPQEALEALFS